MQAANRSVASLLISLTLFLGVALLLATSFFLVFAASLPLFASESVDAQGLILGVSFGFLTVILSAATFFCFQKYLDQPAAEKDIRTRLTGKSLAALLVGTGAALSAGYFAADVETLNWLALPILTIPAVILPIITLAGLGAQHIQLGPCWRAWGIFGLGMTVGPLLILVIEVAIVVFFFIVIILFVAAQPELTAELQSLASKLRLVEDDPDAILQIITPYALRPSVIFTLLLFFAGIVPFIEELIKPVGVWLFAGKLDSPAQGFALGALSGAAFSLIETFGSSAQVSDWAGLLTGRIGTSLLHITSSALMGWGIVLAWKQHQYVKLPLLYLGSSLLHAAWNSAIILFSISFLAAEADSTGFFNFLAPVALGISLLLVMAMLAILIGTNRKLNKAEQPSLSRFTESPPA